ALSWAGKTLRVMVVVAGPGSRVTAYCQTLPAPVGTGPSARTTPPHNNRIRTTLDRAIADRNRWRTGRPCSSMEFDGSETFPQAGSLYARMFLLDRIDHDWQSRLD